jgi:two-component system sensor histidine kinase PilS (NtrC family)
VVFDPDHLRRVLVNLLDNALRYIGKHPDSLQISTGISATGQVGLQVWSDGAPLEKTVEQHLFEPFFSSESRSSGLGLYICRELCERHGATISYQRVPRHTDRGLVHGNAFVVGFRAQRPVAGVEDALDTPLV